jgi:adenosylcobinamide-GDP ribazoletransferase
MTRLPAYAPLAALQFLTLAPPIVRRAFTAEELGWAVGFFPLVGTLLGGVLAGLNWAAGRAFPPGVSAAVVLAAWVAFTGALHLDGFLDACDGLFGGRTPESRLHIMRDERVGAFGLAGGALLLLLKYTALAAIPSRNEALFLAPTLGRWGMALAVVAFPYARAEGLGRTMKDQAGWLQAVLATVVALAVAWLAGSWWGLAALVLAGAATWALGRFVLTRLPGLTGDVYGAVCETLETLVLLLLTTMVGQ